MSAATRSDFALASPSACDIVAMFYSCDSLALATWCDQLDQQSLIFAGNQLEKENTVNTWLAFAGGILKFHVWGTIFDVLNDFHRSAVGWLGWWLVWLIVWRFGWVGVVGLVGWFGGFGWLAWWVGWLAWLVGIKSLEKGLAGFVEHM